MSIDDHPGLSPRATLSRHFFFVRFSGFQGSKDLLRRRLDMGMQHEVPLWSFFQEAPAGSSALSGASDPIGA